MIYLLLLITILIIIFISAYFKVNSLWLIFLVLSFFSGFRYDVGRDYMSYVTIFNDVVNHSYFTAVNEYGYILLIKWVYKIGGTQQLIFFIYSFLTQYFFYMYIKKNSHNYYLPVLTFLCVGPFFLASMSGIRQYLAISFFCYSIEMIKENKMLKIVLLSLIIAFFSHISILLLLPFYFILNKKLSLKSKLLIIIVSLVVSKFINIILKQSLYARYLTVDSEDYVINYTVFLFLPISFLCVVLEKKVNNNILVNMNFFSLLCVLMLFINRDITADIFLRMNNYFFTSFIVLIPYIISKIKTKTVRIAFSFFYVLFLFSYYVRNTFIEGEEMNIVPYSVNFELFG